jgi:hypothetical protein
MARIYLAACMAAALSSAGIGRIHAGQTEPMHIRIEPGQTIQHALFLAKLHARLHARRGAPGASQAARDGGKVFDPVITAGAVVSGTVTVGKSGSLPEIKLTYKTDDGGLGGVEFTFTAPDGVQSLTYSYYPQGYSKSATVTFEANVPTPYYAQPGQWTLTSAFIEDNQFNYTQYDQAQLAALITNPYVSVVNNGPVDITPPVVTGGAILTPTVSLSSPIPVFEATLTGTDDVSGMENAFVGIEPPGGTYSQVDVYNAPFPLLSGTLDAYSPIFTGQPTGTWSITSYSLCDVAGNCFNDTSPADVTSLFGTDTFTVTN